MKKLKKIISATSFLIFCLNLNAQVAIGKPSVQGSSILDFADSTTNGIILPATATFPASPTNGTLIFNRTDSRVYMRQNSNWIALTEGNGNSSSLINNPTSEVGNGVVIGANTSSATGVLVLESSSLALTLPKIDRPHLNVKAPYPGMICYDTASNTVAVFDGAYWNFWK